MFGVETLYSVLNVNAITSIIGVDVNNNPAIFDDVVVPQNCTAEKTINFYMSEPLDNRVLGSMPVYTINCRANTKNESLLIANTVITELNLVNDVNKFINCQLYPTIGPQDDTDNYNTPIRAWVVTK